MGGGSRWIRPGVYPLFAAVGVAVGIGGTQLVRNMCTNPHARVTKEKTAAGVVENHGEGEKYWQHFIRDYVRGKSPQNMPSVNNNFSKPNIIFNIDTDPVSLFTILLFAYIPFLYPRKKASSPTEKSG